MTNARKHVGFYAGDNQLLHAPHTGDVVKIANYNFKGVTKVLRIADGTTVVQQDLSKYRTPVEEMDKFFYKGLAKGQPKISAKTSFLGRIVNFLQEIAMFLLNFILFVLRLPFIGLATLVEVILTYSLEGITGQKGYIVNNNTGILVTVRNDNPEKANKVKEEILYDINFALYTNDVQANVMNQTLKNTVDADKFAKENNISIGKAVFVLNLAAKDSSLDAKELAKMKVTDIANLVAKKGIDIRDIVDYDDDDSIWENIADAIEDIDEDAGSSMKNTADAGNKQIGIEAAKQIALADAKVALKDVTFIKAELDNEDGRAVYEIEFYSGNVEYDYNIDALSGEIISNDFDIEDYSIPTQSAVAPQQTAAAPAQPQTAAPTQLQTAAPTPAPTQPQTTAPTPAPTQPQTAAPTPAPTAAPTPAPTQPAAPSTISADRAKQIALSHAGVGGANFTKVELDTDDGVQVYEIEFKVGNVEYEYDINAISGEIISSKSEVDD